MKTLLRLLGLLLLLALAGGGWLAYEAHTFLNTPPQSEGQEVLFDVSPGARFAQVAAGLEQKGIITDARIPVPILVGQQVRYPRSSSKA